MTDPIPAMPPGMPAEPGLDQLRWLIERTARGEVPVEVFARAFRGAHEALERRGRPEYRSREEARLIWDVLWTLEFYSPDPGRERNPSEWNDARAVQAEVERVARRLQEL
jgi:hypothetical protein